MKLLVIYYYKIFLDKVECGENACMINYDYDAVGRFGEVALTSYNYMYWDHDQEATFTDWLSIKTYTVQEMNFFCDAEYLELDYYFTMQAYFMLG